VGIRFDPQPTVRRKGCKMRFILSALLLALTFAFPCRADDARIVINDDFNKPMKFSAETDNDGIVSIFAVGEIKIGTHLLLEALLDKNHIPAGTEVAFHSPGGNPFEGMEIGRLIRNRHLTTIVAQLNWNHRIQETFFGPAVCASACTLAFLGGTTRAVPEQSLYGVHDVSLEHGEAVPGQLAVGQAIAADISQYLYEMSVNPGFLELFAQYDSSKDEIYWVPHELRLQLRVETAAVQTSWSIKNVFGDNYGYSIVGATPASPAHPQALDEIIFSCDKLSPTRPVVNLFLLPNDQGFIKVDKQYMAETIDKISARSVSSSDADQKTAVIWSKDSSHPTRVFSTGAYIGVGSDLTRELIEFLRSEDQFEIMFSYRSTVPILDIQKKSDGYETYQSFFVDFAPERAEVFNFISGCK
jgi:hypothetical protein